MTSENVDLLRVENSHFSNSNTRQGHSIKSRALSTEVIGCTITDGPDGTSSYLIEAPNGGALIVRGNSLEKGPKSENHKAAIAIGAEASPTHTGDHAHQQQSPQRRPLRDRPAIEPYGDAGDAKRATSSLANDPAEGRWRPI
jgi:hypothetical protein